jgi:hypothetical protein
LGNIWGGDWIRLLFVGCCASPINNGEERKKKRRNKERRASQKEVRSARQMADIASSARHPLLSSPVADVLLIDFNHETKTNEGG